MWKWLAAGCGCAVICSIVVALIFGGTNAGCVAGIFAVIKDSEPYKMSVQLVEKSPEVKEEIGTIKSYGLFPLGNVNYSGDRGDANLTIQVEGEKGKGTLETKLLMEKGKWHFTKAEFTSAASQKKINLLVSD